MTTHLSKTGVWPGHPRWFRLSNSRVPAVGCRMFAHVEAATVSHVFSALIGFHPRALYLICIMPVFQPASCCFVRGMRAG